MPGPARGMGIIAKGETRRVLPVLTSRDRIREGYPGFHGTMCGAPSPVTGPVLTVQKKTREAGSFFHEKGTARASSRITEPDFVMPRKGA